MTTLRCLVAWIAIYLTAVSTLSLCNINANREENTAGGHSIDHSKNGHQKKDDANDASLDRTPTEVQVEDQDGRNIPSDAPSAIPNGASVGGDASTENGSQDKIPRATKMSLSELQVEPEIQKDVNTKSTEEHFAESETSESDMRDSSPDSHQPAEGDPIPTQIASPDTIHERSSEVIADQPATATATSQTKQEEEGTVEEREATEKLPNEDVSGKTESNEEVIDDRTKDHEHKTQLEHRGEIQNRQEQDEPTQDHYKVPKDVEPSDEGGERLDEGKVGSDDSADVKVGEEDDVGSEHIQKRIDGEELKREDEKVEDKEGEGDQETTDKDDGLEKTVGDEDGDTGTAVEDGDAEKEGGEKEEPTEGMEGDGKEAQMPGDGEWREEEEPEGDKDDEFFASFNEWKKKMLEEAQESHDRELGQGGQNTPSVPKFNLNENSKNHASADCGAKILGTNHEATNPTAILNSNRDIYMLNPCSAKSIWFTVELCEPIQVKLVELANFELFSCVPERFRVSISDRYPVREWHQLGTFLARDERALQSFPLSEETMFAKYMKVEMLTFFGSEHFCPLSVLRVFGTSMVEEIDEAESDEGSLSSSEQDVLPVHPTPLPEDLKANGILDHAKDAVFKLVEKAAKVFTGTKNEDGEVYSENVTVESEGTDASEELSDDLQGEKVFGEDKEQDGQYGSGQRNDSFDDTQSGCNGNAICFQENYSDNFQNCCLSLFAQTAGSILICCKALRRDVKPFGISKETGEESNQSHEAGDSDGSEISIQVLQTQMEETQTRVENSIVTSFVLEPTPIDNFVGGGQQDKIETSAPPLIILSTKASSEDESHVGDKVPVSEISPTSTSEAHVLKTEEPTQKIVGGTTSNDSKNESETKLVSSDVKEELDMEVLPIPPPPTVEEIREPSVDEDGNIGSHIDTHKQLDTLQGVIRPTKTSEDSAPTHTSESSLPPKVVQPTEPTNTGDQGADSTKVDSTQGDAIGTSKKGLEPEQKDLQSVEQEKDKKPLPEDTAKDQLATIPSSNSTASKPAKNETEDVQKLPQRATTNGDIKPAAPSNKSSVPDVGNGTGFFSPSASSLSGLGTLPHGTQKESVLMRLNNRIKTLEINMSLSSLYLEELSQRYRKQMDEMQKAFNKKIKTLQESNQKFQEVEQQRVDLISRLETEVVKVNAELDNVTHRVDHILREVVERHLFLMLCEFVIMSLLFAYCLRRTRTVPGAASSPRRQRINGSVTMPMDAGGGGGGNKSVEDIGRRNSDGLLHVPFRDRPGISSRLGAELGMFKDGANSKTGSLDDLLIIGPTTPLREALRQASEPSKQKNKHKNKGKHKSSQPRPRSATMLSDHYKADPTPSSSNSSLASSVSSSSLNAKASPRETASKLSTAGLLFRGPAGSEKRGSGSEKGGGSSREKENDWAPVSQRNTPETVGQVNRVHLGGKAGGVGKQAGGGVGKQAGGGAGKLAGGWAGKKQNQQVNGYGRR